MLALAASRASAAEPSGEIAENDPDAVRIGYRRDASQIDKRTTPGYADGQTCMSCMLFNRKSGTSLGACEAINHRLVTEGGWCKVYVPAM
ncbi:high-potential iron-sulfur protein [Chitinimonas sp.]|uniref:high-potential iron-sulfur protein n=1 Tax=Chitinimonas sp. TaxID=1934313 RepID=UPI0035AF5FD0